MTEELTMIIDLLRDAGAGAVGCYIGYLAYQVLQTVLAITGIVLTLRTIGYVVRSIVDKAARAQNICKHIRDSLGLGCEGCIDSTEFTKIESAVEKMIIKSRE